MVSPFLYDISHVSLIVRPTVSISTSPLNLNTSTPSAASTLSKQSSDPLAIPDSWKTWMSPDKDAAAKLGGKTFKVSVFFNIYAYISVSSMSLRLRKYGIFLSFALMPVYQCE
jgi:hypothetical protein